MQWGGRWSCRWGNESNWRSKETRRRTESWWVKLLLSSYLFIKGSKIILFLSLMVFLFFWNVWFSLKHAKTISILQASNLLLWSNFPQRKGRNSAAALQYWGHFKTLSWKHHYLHWLKWEWHDPSCRDVSSNTQIFAHSWDSFVNDVCQKSFVNCTRKCCTRSKALMSSTLRWIRLSCGNTRHQFSNFHSWPQLLDHHFWATLCWQICTIETMLH